MLTTMIRTLTIIAGSKTRGVATNTTVAEAEVAVVMTGIGATGGEMIATRSIPPITGTRTGTGTGEIGIEETKVMVTTSRSTVLGRLKSETVLVHAMMEETRKELFIMLRKSDVGWVYCF